MTRGRKPKPTAQRKLEGNPGRRPFNAEEPELPPASPVFDEPPAELLTDADAAKEWRRLVPLLRLAGLITEAERGSLLALCQQWSRYLEAQRGLAKGPMIVESPSGYPMPNPYNALVNRALANCARLWAELGLTPSSRSRVARAPMIEAPADAFAEFDADGPPGTKAH